MPQRTRRERVCDDALADTLTGDGLGLLVMVKVGHRQTRVRVTQPASSGAEVFGPMDYKELGGVIIDRAMKAEALAQTAVAQGVCPLAEMPTAEERRLDGDIRLAKNVLDREDLAEVQVWTPLSASCRFSPERRCGGGFVTARLPREVVDLATNQLAAWLRDAVLDTLERAEVDPGDVRRCCAIGGPLVDPLLGELLVEVMPWPVLLAQQYANSSAADQSE